MICFIVEGDVPAAPVAPRAANRRDENPEIRSRVVGASCF